MFFVLSLYALVFRCNYYTPDSRKIQIDFKFFLKNSLYPIVACMINIIMNCSLMTELSKHILFDREYVLFDILHDTVIINKNYFAPYARMGAHPYDKK